MSDIVLNVKLDQLRRELSAAGVYTDKQVNGMVQTFGRGFKKIERESAQAQRKMARDAERAAKAIERTMEHRVQSIRRVSGVAFGGITEDISDVVEAAAAFGPHGIAFAAGLAAVAAPAATIALLGKGLWDAAWAAEEAAKRIEALPEALRPLTSATEDETQATKDLGIEWAALTSEIDAWIVDIGSRAAPMIRAITQGATIALRETRGAFVAHYEWLEKTAQAYGLTGLKEYADLVSAGQSQAKRQVVSPAAQSAMDAAAALALGGGKPPGKAGDLGRPSRSRSSATPTTPEVAGVDTGPAISFAQEYAEMEAENQATREAGLKKIKELEEEELQRQLDLKDARTDAALAAVSGAVDIAEALGASAKTMAAAALIETIAYQAVAVARAFAEGGPYAGPVMAAAALATIGVQIAKLASVSGMGGGGGAGASGGGGAGTPRSARPPANPNGPQAQQAPVSITMQYEHRGFKDFFDDHQRGQAGNRSRGKRSQRPYAGR